MAARFRTCKEEIACWRSARAGLCGPLNRPLNGSASVWPTAVRVEAALERDRALRPEGFRPLNAGPGGMSVRRRVSSGRVMRWRDLDRDACDAQICVNDVVQSQTLKGRDRRHGSLYQCRSGFMATIERLRK
jgi:hypothetical protein